MKHHAKTITIVIVAVILLVIAAAAQIALVFNVTSAQIKQSGADRLEIAGGELEDTINEAKLSTMRYAIELQPYLENQAECEAFIRKKKQEMAAATGDVCFNVYAASGEWDFIPDFIKPEDYDILKRSWFTGALRKQGKPFVTDPYVDAMTGNICFTVSVLLHDGKTVAAMDYTMEEIQHHITLMYRDGSQKAIIVTAEGIIAGCSDASLLGKSLVQELPDYAGVFSLAKTSYQTVAIHQRGENLFAARSGFGWFLIVSENNWSLYRTSYMELIYMLVISISMFAVILTLYVLNARTARKTAQRLSEQRETISGLTVQLDSAGALLGDSDRITKDMLRSVRDTLRDMIRHEGKKKELQQKNREMKLSRQFRTVILAALLMVMTISMYINITASVQYGKGQMQRVVTDYDQQLTEWIKTQKSILDMFCSMISTDPECMNQYEEAVAYLDGITKQYPEISVSYFTNPGMEHPVIMSNGWEPGDEWDVEDRIWYKELMASDKNWIISTPYFDAQTGLYCVTLAERIYDDRTGKFLGNFGIDFYMDKLVDILGSSYTEQGYAFLADASGEIINHPYGKYQMTEKGAVNVISLPYNNVPLDGDQVEIIRDYTDSYKAAIASRNELTGFTVYVVSSIWMIYQEVLIYGTLCFLVLIVCMVLVYKVMTRLLNLQEEANRQLRDSAEAAIAADEAKSTFLAQMSHEIRTPINAVLGMNEMILHESADPEIREYAGNIQSSGRTLLTLINSILDFSKIEDGKMEIIPAPYNTAMMIHDLVNSVSQRAKDKGLELTVEADETLPAVMKGDDVRIRQVITNLLTNAVKYTEKGSVRLILRKESARERGSVLLYVEVTDTGIGIRDEDLKDLFQSFKRLDVSRNRNIEGTGLGMSIVTKLLDMMGSKLFVRSVYGKGSTFGFRLKQEVVDAAPMGAYQAYSASVSEPPPRDEALYAPDARILVVDDNAMNLQVAEKFLMLFGIRADLVNSGAAALEKLKDAQYDIIFLDHMMPDMDGIETLGEIRSRSLVPEQTAIIALTANAIVGAREMYLAAGFTDYLTKPVELKAMEAQLYQYLPEACRKVRKPEVQDDETGDTAQYADLIAVREICPALNVMEGLGNCMDSWEFWMDTLEGFCEANKLEVMQKAFEAEDFENYRIAVHSVKSAAKTIGADVLSEQARALEFAARDGETAYIRAHHAEFTEAYQTMLHAIERILKHE